MSQEFHLTVDRSPNGDHVVYTSEKATSAKNALRQYWKREKNRAQVYRIRIVNNDSGDAVAYFPSRMKGGKSGWNLKKKVDEVSVSQVNQFPHLEHTKNDSSEEVSDVDISAFDGYPFSEENYDEAEAALSDTVGDEFDFANAWKKADEASSIVQQGEDMETDVMSDRNIDLVQNDLTKNLVGGEDFSSETTSSEKEINESADTSSDNETSSETNLAGGDQVSTSSTEENSDDSNITSENNSDDSDDTNSSSENTSDDSSESDTEKHISENSSSDSDVSEDEMSNAGGSENKMKTPPDLMNFKKGMKQQHGQSLKILSNAKEMILKGIKRINHILTKKGKHPNQGIVIPQNMLVAYLCDSKDEFENMSM